MRESHLFSAMAAGGRLKPLPSVFYSLAAPMPSFRCLPFVTPLKMPHDGFSLYAFILRPHEVPSRCDDTMRDITSLARVYVCGI